MKLLLSVFSLFFLTLNVYAQKLSIDTSFGSMGSLKLPNCQSCDRSSLGLFTDEKNNVTLLSDYLDNNLLIPELYQFDKKGNPDPNFGINGQRKVIQPFNSDGFVQRLPFMIKTRDGGYLSTYQINSPHPERFVYAEMGEKIFFSSI